MSLMDSLRKYDSFSVIAFSRSLTKSIPSRNATYEDTVLGILCFLNNIAMAFSRGVDFIGTVLNAASAVFKLLSCQLEDFIKRSNG